MELKSSFDVVDYSIEKYYFLSIRYFMKKTSIYIYDIVRVIVHKL